MVDKTNGLATLSVVAILTLLLGGFIGALAFSNTNTIEKLVEVPKEVKVPVEVIKEVEKVVEVKEIDALKQAAIDAFLEEVADDDDLLECDGIVYDEDQVVVTKVYDIFSYELLNNKDNKYVVETKVKLKYLDKDVEEKCYKTFDIEVTFEDDEDAVVDYTEL